MGIFILRQSITCACLIWGGRAQPSHLGNGVRLLRNDAVLRVQLITQLGHLPLVVVHVVGIVVVESPRQVYRGARIALHADLLLQDAVQLHLCQAQLILDQCELPPTVGQRRRPRVPRVAQGVDIRAQAGLELRGAGRIARLCFGFADDEEGEDIIGCVRSTGPSTYRERRHSLISRLLQTTGL